MKRWRVLVWVAVAAAGVAEPGRAAPAAPVPVIFQSAPGRFEVAALDGGDAQRVAALAGQLWPLLAGPLALPESFASPVFVRLVPAAEWGERSPFRVTVEAGGVVAVRVGWDATTRDVVVRRALVQGLLMRQAVARHGVNERLTAPLWLEHACVGWWRTRAEPAQLDALKQTTARQVPPGLEALLHWQRGGAEPGPFVDGAVWLLAFLTGEGGKAGEWPALLHRLLGGGNPGAALAASFPGRYANDDERELWWQTGWHQLRCARVLPGWEAAESRGELAEMVRFVFRRQGADAVIPLREVLERAGEPAVDRELKRRVVALNRGLTALHPFYRNAALSLADALAVRGADAARRDALCAAFEQDWRDATELEGASAAALDALAARADPSSNE